MEQTNWRLNNWTAAIEEIIKQYSNNGDSQIEGMADTPRRYINFLEEFFNPDPFKFTTFQPESYDEMIWVKDIPFYSLCEHHMLPFFGTAHVAYIPTNRICGLSKIPRVVDFYARRFQNQERITTQIAERIQSELMPLGVAVVLEARHLCMEMRGIKKPNTITTTAKLIGKFKEEIATRQEFYNLIKK
jgi:GTP cyclohydrolase I